MSDEVTFHWITDKVNPSDIFTKEDNDVKHYTYVRDQMLLPREDFGIELRVDHQLLSHHKLHPRGVLRNGMEHYSELINTQNITGKEKSPHGDLVDCEPPILDESEPFNFGSFTQPIIATE